MRLLTLALLGSAFLLPGCGSLLTAGTADLAGIAGAGAASSVTKSAAAAAAIGLGVQSLASEGLKYAERGVHRSEQQAIADAAGPLEPGAVGTWSVVHRVPIEEDEAGQVSVSRSFGAGSVQCKEVVFSVERSRREVVTDRTFYLTTICRRGEEWHWAAAEPATERWGSLQ